MCVRRSFLIFLIGILAFSTFGQMSKHGDKTVIAPDEIVNEFTTLLNDAFFGEYSIKVADAACNAGGHFPAPLSPGDLIMIIQMQGAAINANLNDSTWGAVTSYNGSGFYEFAEVYSISANTIQLSCPLAHDYFSNGKTQVVRVPRFSSLTIKPEGVLTAPPWNGETGGILVLEVENETVIENGGRMDVSGLGFRGGDIKNISVLPGVFDFVSPRVGDGGEKGESIAGFGADYDRFGGRYGRGAPANGGGGGNAHNSGGGGGANAGNIIAYTGNGNPDNTNISWKSAWDLEYDGYSSSSSSGGGRGGYSFALSDENALLTPPGDSLWEGDYRKNTGGKGGRPLDYSTGRLFLGGGGGAGDANNGEGGGAGSGGGIVYLLSYGTLSGNGKILANGEDGDKTTGSGRDGAGGGGAGGTVLLDVKEDIEGISVKANGGNGGSQFIDTGQLPNESEGPGGGGGGGYIAIRKGNINRVASGGMNGTTNSTALNEFTPNGATAGGKGTADAKISSVFYLTSADFSSAGVCLNEPTVLHDQTKTSGDPVVKREWNFGDGSADTTNHNPVHIYAAPGIYEVSMNIITERGCKSSVIKQVAVYAVPQAGFDSDPQQTSISDPVVNFTDRSEGAISQFWSFGDGTTALDRMEIAHEFSNETEGEYPVELVVYNAEGCSDTARQVIEITSEFSFYMPNAFTPNGDGSNDVFTGKGTGIREFQMWIYDRWGTMIFFTEDRYRGWDGKVQNRAEIVQQGVYVWKVTVTDFSGKIHHYMGHVTLVL